MSNAILKKIRSERKSRDISQETMAKELLISIPSYSRFERGLTKTNLDILLKTCELLDLDISNIKPATKPKSQLPPEDYKDKNTYIRHQMDAIINLLEEQQRTNKLLVDKFKELNNIYPELN